MVDHLVLAIQDSLMKCQASVPAPDTSTLAIIQHVQQAQQPCTDILAALQAGDLGLARAELQVPVDVWNTCCTR